MLVIQIGIRDFYYNSCWQPLQAVGWNNLAPNMVASTVCQWRGRPLHAGAGQLEAASSLLLILCHSCGGQGEVAGESNGSMDTTSSSLAQLSTTS